MAVTKENIVVEDQKVMPDGTIQKRIAFQLVENGEVLARVDKIVTQNPTIKSGKIDVAAMDDAAVKKEFTTAQYNDWKAAQS